MDRRLCEHRRGAAGHPAAPGELGFGLLGTVIGITTQQLYTYHWDNQCRMVVHPGMDTRNNNRLACHSCLHDSGSDVPDMLAPASSA